LFKIFLQKSEVASKKKKKIDGGFKLEQIILLKNMISFLFIFLGLNSTAGKTSQSDLLHKFHEN